MATRFIVSLLVGSFYIVHAKPMNATVYVQDHSECLVADWMQHDNAMKFTNAVASFTSGAVRFVQRQLDPIRLPAPIMLQIRNSFFGKMYQIDLNVENLSLRGLSEIQVKALRAVRSTSVETGLEVESMYFDLQIALSIQKMKRRKWGIDYCPGSLKPFASCPVSRGLMRVEVQVKEADIRLVLDLFVYDCDRLPDQQRFGKLACRVKSALEYMLSLFQGVEGVGERLLSRVHDINVRKTSVGFRSLDVDMHIESRYAVMFDPSIFGFLQMQINSEFEGGAFHDSICAALGNAVENIASGAIANFRPSFTAAHLTH